MRNKEIKTKLRELNSLSLIKNKLKIFLLIMGVVLCPPN